MVSVGFTLHRISLFLVLFILLMVLLVSMALRTFMALTLLIASGFSVGLVGLMVLIFLRIFMVSQELNETFGFSDSYDSLHFAVVRVLVVMMLLLVFTVLLVVIVYVLWQVFHILMVMWVFSIFLGF